MNLEPIKAPTSSAVNRYARVQGKTQIGENVLVSQRAFLDTAVIGDGSNAQENSYIIHSTLAGLNVTTHGGKLLYAIIGRETYIGFNAFLNGKSTAQIAHLVFCQHTKSQPKKTKRAISCQHTELE